MTTALPIVGNPDPPLTSNRALPPLHQRFTREGSRLYRKIAVDAFGAPRFWTHWKKHPLVWAERGWSIAKEDTTWYLQQWLTSERTLTPFGVDRLAQVTRPASPEQAEMGFDHALILPALPNGLESKLWDYQVQPARQLYRAVTHGAAEWGYPGAVDLSDMGTGKTAMALAAALATGRRVAVLCPVVGRAGWEKMFSHFGAEPHFIGTYEAVRGGWREHIVRERPDGSFEWQAAGEIVLILDEAQALRHDSTLTVRCCSAAIRQGIPIIIASATVAISPLEMRFAGRITGLHHGGEDWLRFLVKHGCRLEQKAWRWDGRLEHLRRIHGRLFPRRGCRVRRESLGDRCPQTEISVMPLDVPEAFEIERQWREALNLFSELQARGVNRREILMRERMARMKVWQRCESALIEPVAALAKRDLADGRSIVVFLNFNESRDRMGRLLGTRDGFYGGQSHKLRALLERQFQSNAIKVLISNIGAGGASVSLHDVTGERPRTAYIFPTDRVVQMAQATGRIDRVGGQSISRQFIPCVHGTLTERMVQSTRRKMLGISTLNDGEGSSRI